MTESKVWFLPKYHKDWVVLGFRWVDGWVPLTTTMCVIPPSYQALSGSYPNHQTSSSTGESQVRPPLTAYQVRVYENNLHSRGHITIALPNCSATASNNWKESQISIILVSKNVGSKRNWTQKAWYMRHHNRFCFIEVIPHDRKFKNFSATPRVGNIISNGEDDDVFANADALVVKTVWGLSTPLHPVHPSFCSETHQPHSESESLGGEERKGSRSYFRSLGTTGRSQQALRPRV